VSNLTVSDQIEASPPPPPVSVDLEKGSHMEAAELQQDSDISDSDYDPENDNNRFAEESGDLEVPPLLDLRQFNYPYY
jgi:hypothetical protein